MCDVLVAMPDSTKRRTVIFAKNSDRPAGECQVLHYSSGSDHRKEKDVRCCYVTVPQSERVLATLGCRPYWCRGYETGMNEAGVIGGNTAVFTRGLRYEQEKKIPGLIGMELLRFGLERGESAEKAMSVIIELLEKYGQWGSGVMGKNHLEGSYDNAFMLADRKEAWVLETSDCSWAAIRITEGVRTLSNQLTIRDTMTRSSADLEKTAHARGWWKSGNQAFDFAFAYSDHEQYARQVSHIRQMRSLQLLFEHKGRIEIATMMRILRDHYEETFLKGPQFNPYLPDFLTLCMHDSPAGFTWGNTATSAVVELDPRESAPPHIWLAYLPPCSSVYIAYPFSDSLPEAAVSAGQTGLGSWRAPDAPQDTFSESSLWWRLQRIIDQIARDPHTRIQKVRSLFDPLEKHHADLIGRLMSQEGEDRKQMFNDILQDEISGVVEAIRTLEKEWKIA